MFKKISRMQRAFNTMGMKSFSHSKITRSEVAVSDMSDPLNPYHHTTGRWLHRDKLQHELRYVEFNFSALCQKVLEMSFVSGAQKIVRYEKKDVGANRVFIFHMDNGSRFVAKLPFQIAGPPKLTTNSEVATMAYIRKHTKIHIPEVLTWSDDNANPIGSEYVIMEHATGVQLREQWPSMDKYQHTLCMQNLADLVAQMANIPFPAYGSIYFDDAPIDPRSKIALGEFCIGPHCGLQYWDCNAGEDRFYHQAKPNRGPWPNLRGYCSALIDMGLSHIPPIERAPQNEPSYQGSVEEHLRLLKFSEIIIGKLVNTPIIQNISAPTLLHPDLCGSNIFVSEDDPTRITALIDWQSTSIDPVFNFSDSTPHMITLPTPLEEEDEDNSEDDNEAEDSPEGQTVEELERMAEEDAQRKEEYERIAREEAEQLADLSISRQAFEMGVQAGAPKLHVARTTDKTLLGPFDCYNSWNGSATALRQKLMELSKRWTELGLPDTCPYGPTEKELADHVTQHEDYVAVQRLRPFLMCSLDSTYDGWVPLERWEEVRQFHKSYFDWYMFCVAMEDGDEEQGEKMWPFDDAKGKKDPMTEPEHEPSKEKNARI